MKKIIILISISLVALATALAATTFSRELEEKAILGDAAAMHELSVCYRMGTGVAKDLDKANYWLERAAQEGNPNALATLELLDNKTSLTEAKRRELAAIEARERERLLHEKEKQRIAEERRLKEEEEALVKDELFLVKGVSFKMIGVHGGEFSMGANVATVGTDDDEFPVHQVMLSSFGIAQTEVTQELWNAVMGNNPSKFKGNKLPVECVSWNDCIEFIEKLNALTGRVFRLPTEAEWEYAARGGHSGGYKYSGSDNIYDVAWYETNSSDKTHKVASKQSNELGLYDMSGNVWEWCQDLYDYHYYSFSETRNPIGPKKPNNENSYVLRGGCFQSFKGHCCVSTRSQSKSDSRTPSIGLRLAYSLGNRNIH